MAAELVGGALLSSFLQVIFDRLVSRQVLDYFHGRKLDEMLLNKLKMKLLSINAITDDAEQKQYQNPGVRDWLLEVKDVLDAEDLFDEIHYETMKHELQAESHTTAKKVWNFFNTSFVNLFDKEIESRIKQMLESLEFLSSLKSDLGLKEVRGIDFSSGSGSKVTQKLPSTSLVVESVIYGREDDKEIIFDWLTSDTDNCNQLSILSVVGMGGMGKTTLAQHIYNDPRLEEAKFDIKAWVCVSDNFDVLTVTRVILEAITKSKDDSGHLEMVHGRLKEKLAGKRFLLVLDDIWNEEREKWEAVQSPLNYGARGSRVLVTTRIKKVASAMRSNKVHHLKQLQKDHCWQIFATHAFQDDISQFNNELKEIGIKIVEKCKGLPLALKTIGSLLHTKSSISEWESVLTSEIWNLLKEDSQIIPALLLSYHHLPSHLKRCFAYCALFPKDYEFIKDHLIQLWLAENFLQCHDQSKSLEEVGEQYFNDLLSRSFFQQYGTWFVMHDLLNDLAKYVSEDICFRLGVDKAEGIPKLTRHFSFVVDDHQCFDGFGSLYDAKRLRTFIPTCGGMNVVFGWYCKISMNELFSKFKFLHVLSLYGCSVLTEVPNLVGDLKHLRSLDFSFTGIKKLPDSICLLYNLQILKLNCCFYFEELPSNMDKLTNLRLLEFGGTKVRRMPEHLGKMKNLQVLPSFYVGKSSELGIQQLRELNLHERLSIQQLQNIENPLHALEANLKNKTHLVRLSLEWDWNWNHNQIADDLRKEREVLENLQPSKHLKNLSISNYGGTQFPSWLFDNSLLNMVSLTLNNCKYCLCLPSLGLLPFLKSLKISGLDGIVHIDTDFYGSSFSSFTSLESLDFRDMKEWEEWECRVVTGAFPRLEFLSIVGCPKFKGHLPVQLVHLRGLVIRNCKEVVATAPKALKIDELNLQDCGKLQFENYPTTLKWLTIIGHNMQVSSLEMIGNIISNNSLKSLFINCPIMNIPMNHAYDFLETLKIKDSCDSLTTFPLDLFPKVYSLHLTCQNLQMISQEHTHNHLNVLSISECPQFESFPTEGLSAPWLKMLRIKGLVNLKSLPEKMHILLPSLDDLQIEGCPKVESFPDGGLPPNIKQVDISYCSKLITSLKETLGVNISLNLSIGKVDGKSFPNQGLLLDSIASLCIYDCKDLEELNYKGLSHLSSLKELILRDCPRLQCLPEEGLPKSISTLMISRDCPWLKKNFQLNAEGGDWGKIAHIQQVLIDGKRIK